MKKRQACIAAMLTFAAVSILHVEVSRSQTVLQTKDSRVIASAVKIASLSYVPVKWDKEANLKTISKMAREAASQGAQLLITPEGGLEGYLIDELLKSSEREKWEPQFREIAEPSDGPSVMKVRDLARELGVDLAKRPGIGQGS